jgi:tRNA(Ile2) C34 agmatinyltransferase TiaS
VCGTSGSFHIHHNNKDHHDLVDLNQTLGEQGEPALCVVCGRWDETKGKKRKSGHKCNTCVGQKSLERLRLEFQRLLESETNEEEDADLVPEGYQADAR